MRKRMKDKRRCCAMCKPHKPHKRKWEGRWKRRDLDFIERAEREMKAFAP